MSDGLSAKTRAEMYGGAASIGVTKESVDHSIALANVWRVIAVWEGSMREQFPNSTSVAKAMVWQDGRSGDIMVEPFINDPNAVPTHPARPAIKFPRETPEQFPSPELNAKIMLVLG